MTDGDVFSNVCNEKMKLQKGILCGSAWAGVTRNGDISQSLRERSGIGSKRAAEAWTAS
jgi:hypothetical protein